MRGFHHIRECLREISYMHHFRFDLPFVFFLCEGGLAALSLLLKQQEENMVLKREMFVSILLSMSDKLTKQDK